MKVLNARCCWILSIAAIAVAALGCGNTDSTDFKSATGDIVNQTASGAHSGWWCVEHGIPEEECSMCSTKAAAGFRAKGDWCEEHNRAKSQCFICDPKAAEPFAKLYEAKYGKQPPPISQ